MFAMVGVYWTAFGLWFALGLVLSIYVHEMGHVAALARYGYPASAPLFIPGLGAVIRLKQGFSDPRAGCGVGLAGPLWGLGAALICAMVFALTDEKIWAALAQFGALINLLQPDADLATRRRPRLPQPEPTPALAGRDRPGDRLGHHRRRPRAPADAGRRRTGTLRQARRSARPGRLASSTSRSSHRSRS